MKRIFLGSLIAAIALPAQAQNLVVPDATLGNERSIVEPRPGFDAITGGATRGTGLFHSFSEFGVGDRANVQFVVRPEIQNIFARVTGGNVSNILGTIGTGIEKGDGSLTGTTAGLFLLNPNGIVFGPNAKLDLGGSFLATTASSFKFGGNQAFSAVNPQPAPLLTVSAPIGLQFGEKVGAIEVNSATLATSVTQSLGLIGGNVKLNDAKLTTITGQLDLGAVEADTTVGLLPLQVGWKADYTGVEKFRDIQIDRGQITAGMSSVGDLAVFPVDLQLQGQNITLNGATLFYYYDEATQANLKTGAVNLNAGQSLLLNRSRILVGTDGSIDRPDIILKANQIQLKGTKPNESGLITTTLGDGVGAGGNIKIISNDLTIDGATVTTGLQGRGQAGDIEINVAGPISILGSSVYPTALLSIITDKESQGSTGDIRIRAKNLAIADGGYISLLSSNQSQTGIIDIQIEDGVTITGTVPAKNQRFVGLQSNISNAQDSSKSPTDQIIPEQSLGIKIQAKSLLLQDGGQINTSIISGFDAKTIQIDIQDSIKIQGISQNAFIGRDANPTFQNSEISSSKLKGSGNSGNIRIRTRSLELREGGQIESDINDGLSGSAAKERETAVFQGKGGNITIEASDSVLVSGASTQPTQPAKDLYISSEISSSVVGGNAQGGTILIKTRDLQVNDGGSISADILQGQGEAGRIEIEGGSVTIAGRSKTKGASSSISSFSSTPNRGNAGAIRIRSESLNILEGGSLSAASVGAGDAGNIFVETRGDINVSGINDRGVRSSISSGAVQLSETALQQYIQFNLALPGEPLGEGGSIFLTGNTLRVSDDALISARSEGKGRAGNINISLRDRAILNNGEILTSAEKTTGGNIDISARAIVLRNNSNIKTSVASGTGQGGNISLIAKGIVLLDDSDLLAFARDGQGGNISLFTKALLTRTYRPSTLGADLETLDKNSFVDINATGRTSGIITLPELNPLQNNRPEFTPTLIDTDNLLSRSCLTRNPKTGKFIITGAGGIPQNPSDPPLSTYSTLPVTTTTTLAEADSLYSLPNGQTLLAKRCPTPP